MNRYKYKDRINYKLVKVFAIRWKVWFSLVLDFCTCFLAIFSLFSRYSFTIHFSHYFLLSLFYFHILLSLFSIPYPTLIFYSLIIFRMLETTKSTRSPQHTACRSAFSLLPQFSLNSPIYFCTLIPPYSLLHSVIYLPSVYSLFSLFIHI